MEQPGGGASSLRRAFEGDLPVAARALVLLAWAVALVVVTAHHEPWRDEADAWLFARDVGPSPAALRHFTAGAGTPALWYVLLLPLAKAGAPYWTLNALHLALAGAVVALIVLRAPLPPALRVLLPFSYLLGYEYAVVARSYVLTVLLLFVAAALHHRRRERPLLAGLVIGLLANTNAHGFFLAFGLGVGLLVELAGSRPPGWRGAVGLALALGALALWQLVPHAEGQLLPSVTEPLNRAVGAIASGIVPAAPGAPSLWTGGLALRLLALVGGVAVVVAVVAGMATRADRAALLLGLGGLLYIFGFRYPGDVRHHGLVAALVVWALWIHGEAPPPDPRRRRLLLAASTGLAVALLAGLPTLLATWRLELREPFSGSREVAEVLRAEGLDAGPIVAHRPNQTSAVLPYLRAPTLWYAGLEADRSHMAWDVHYTVAQHRVSIDEAAARAARRFPGGATLLLSEPLPDPARHGLRLVFRSTRPAFRTDEVYWVYRPAR